jgi:hypothetical protein
VTIPAIEAELADVEPVAVRNRLNWLVAHVRIPRREVVPNAGHGGGRHEDAGEGGHER